MQLDFGNNIHTAIICQNQTFNNFEKIHKHAGKW